MELTLRLTESDKLLPVIAQLLAGISPAANTAIVPVPTAFPADPTQAPAPSPDSSTMMLFNGAIVGPPYLRDKDGSVWMLTIAEGSSPPQGLVIRNGSRLMPADPSWGYTQIIVRAGQVWSILAQGQSQYFNNGSLYNGAMPDAAGPAVPAPAAPIPAALPTPSAVAPGSSGKVIQCGMGQAIPTLSEAIKIAQAGDKIQLAPGSYSDTPPAWSVPLLIDLGGATFDGTNTATLARGKGLLVPCADSIIQNGTILNVAADQTSGQLTSAIRPDAGCGYLTIRNMIMHGNQCAVGEGGTGNIVIAIEGGDISNNGLKVNTGSFTHNVYVGADCRRLTLTNVVADGAVEAHSIKFRGQELIVDGGVFASAPGKPFDLPNGGGLPFKITGASIVKRAGDDDHGILAYGEEGATNGTAGGTISGCTVSAGCDNPTITVMGGTISVTNCTLSGNKISAVGSGVVTGI